MSGDPSAASPCRLRTRVRAIRDPNRTRVAYNGAMHEGPDTRRRFCFGLRALLILTMLMAVVFAVSAKWPAYDRFIVAPRRVVIVDGWEVRYAPIANNVERPPTS